MNNFPSFKWLSISYFSLSFSSFIGRFDADIPIECLLPTIFVIISYTMGGVVLSAIRFLASLGAILLTILITQALGLLLGAAFSTYRDAQARDSFVLQQLALALKE